MNTPSKRTFVATGAALLTFAGGAYAVASGSAPTAITSSVTGKLGDAVSSKYPGSTITGIHSETGGGFNVEVRKSDGTEVHVTVDENYTITGERTGGPGTGGGMMGGGHHGGMMGRGLDTAALAKTLGVSEDKLTAALGKVRQDRPGQDELVANLAKALGASESDVQSVLDDVKGSGAGPGGGPGPGPGGPGKGGRGMMGDELVSALAKKTGKNESAVRTALRDARPDRGDRRDAVAEALAKELGLDASKVKSALEAQRPNRDRDPAPATTP